MDRGHDGRQLAAPAGPDVPARGVDQTSGAMPVSLVCCGLIGTAVDDRGMVDRAYAEAIATQGVVTGTAAYARCMAYVHQARGQHAVEVLRAMFPDSQARAQAAHIALDRSFCDAIGRTGVTPVPGAEAVIDKLRGAGVRICLITGFSRRVLTAVLDTLGWCERVDLALSAQDVPRGTPWPDLVLSAMLRLGVADVRETAVAHHAESGILCGRRAGCRSRRGGRPPSRAHPPLRAGAWRTAPGRATGCRAARPERTGPGRPARTSRACRAPRSGPGGKSR